ncbi:MAG: hypothetical protein WBA54_14345 [Acidaminobacteraceae bacterium]
MFDFLFKGKKKDAIRSQIVDSFIGNLIKCEAGDNFDECGNIWTKRSFDEVMEYFDDNSFESEFSIATKDMHNWVVDLKNPSICDTYNVLHNIYFGKCATEFEHDKLRFEFKKKLESKGLKGLKKTYDNHFDS